jgi:choline-sulfatase
LLTSGNLTKLSEKGGRPFYTSISSSNIQIERTSPFLTQDHFKFNYYVGFEPELFDLKQDPQELNNLAAEKAHAERVHYFEKQLRGLLDPEAIDKKAKADQNDFVFHFKKGRACNQIK